MGGEQKGCFSFGKEGGGEREWGESKKDVSPLAKKGGGGGVRGSGGRAKRMFLLWQRRGGVEREWGESKKDVSPLAKKGG